jgi:hypothetical protein
MVQFHLKKIQNEQLKWGTNKRQLDALRIRNSLYKLWEAGFTKPIPA